MRKLHLTLVAGLLALAAATNASAHDSFGFSINLGVPGYYAGPPVVYAPPPVYYRPPVVYYQPEPVYYGPSFYYRYYDGPRFRYDHGDRHGWRGRWHDRD